MYKNLFFEEEALTQVYSYKFCEIFKNSFFIEHLRWLLLSSGLVQLPKSESKLLVCFRKLFLIFNATYQIPAYLRYHMRSRYGWALNILICLPNLKIENLGLCTFNWFVDSVFFKVTQVAPSRFAILYCILLSLTELLKLFPVDTGRKLNAHKTFRRRPGRLLNVLCTYNLRPVSTG